jgi:hypothetical protein
MKAIVIIHLARKTRMGRSIITEKIERKKENIVNAVNDYIYERTNRKNFIPVVKFEVKILNYKNKVVNQWEYTPTNRG